MKELFIRIRNFIRPAYVARPGQLPPSWQPYRDYIEIHPTALIATTATIQIFSTPATPKKMIKIGAQSHIFANIALLRAESEICIGQRCQIGSSHIIAAEKINIDDDVLMAWGCTVMDSDTHSKNWEERKNDVATCYRDYLKNPKNLIATKDWANVPCAPVSIGDRCWIGFNTIILKGVTLGTETIVGAGSVVRKSAPSHSTVAGNPASLIQ